MSRKTGIALTSQQVQLVEPTFDSAPMTTADSVVCTVVGAGATFSSSVISTANMTYTADLIETNTWGWYANIGYPAAPQTIHIHVEANKGGATGRWHETVVVKPFV